jgi:hypothetical protein
MAGRQLELAVSVLNLYNRQNVFYFDRITQTRVNQLPIMPSFGAVLKF